MCTITALVCPNCDDIDMESMESDAETSACPQCGWAEVR